MWFPTMWHFDMNRGFATSQNATGLQGHLAWKSTGHPNFQLAQLFFNIEAALDVSALTSFHPLACALYIVNELEATRKRSGNHFISWNSSIISNSNGVGIWIRIRLHIHSFKSVIVQFHHTPLNVRLYLHIRVEIKPSLVNQGSTLWNKKKWYNFSFQSLNLKELTCLNLDNGLCFYFYCRSKHE